MNVRTCTAVALAIASALAAGCRGTAPQPEAAPAEATGDRGGRARDGALDVRDDDPAALLAEMRRRVAQEPSDAESWRTLARCLLHPDLPREQRDPTVAVEAAQTALELRGGDDPSYLVTLGTAHYLHGDVGAAIRAYENALAAAARGAGELDGIAELRALVAELKRERG